MHQRSSTISVGGWRGLLAVMGVAIVCALGCAQATRTAPKNATTTKTVEARVQTPPPTLFEVNRRLPPRHQVLKAEGKPGESLVIWRGYYRNGKEVRRVKVREEVLEPPQPRIYEIGVHGHIASRGAVGRSGAFRTVKVLTMHASAYTAHRSGGGTGSGRTATGLPAGYGLVAVDPRVIPLGTVLYIEGYGMAIAADTRRASRRCSSAGAKCACISCAPRPLPRRPTRPTTPRTPTMRPQTPTRNHDIAARLRVG